MHTEPSSQVLRQGGGGGGGDRLTDINTDARCKSQASEQEINCRTCHILWHKNKDNLGRRRKIEAR